ncbi:MAG: hypothetical protein ABH844_00205 [Candidatus Omnitrophota bacterium]
MMTEEKPLKSASSGSVYAVLSYLWVLCLIPVLMKKNDEFVRFHSRQGLMLFIIEVGVGIISIIPIFGPLIYTLGVLIFGLISLIAIVQVLMGNKWRIPIIGEWAEKMNV